MSLFEERNWLIYILNGGQSTYWNESTKEYKRLKEIIKGDLYLWNGSYYTEAELVNSVQFVRFLPNWHSAFEASRDVRNFDKFNTIVYMPKLYQITTNPLISHISDLKKHFSDYSVFQILQILANELPVGTEKPLIDA